MLWRLCEALILASVLAGALPLVLHGRGNAQRALSALLLGLSGVLSALVGVSALLYGADITARLPIGLPWLHWQLRLDNLSAFFLLIVGVVVTAAGIYSHTYNREYLRHPRELTAITVFSGLFVAGMQLVLLADDAFAFMIAWELMSLSSYFLVASTHHLPATRRAAFLYLLMAHVSGISILLAFGVLSGFSGSFAFETMRAHPVEMQWAAVAFALALFGFGTKAGLLPMHGWLPDAHPVAPAPVSAIMSAAMVKIALYGFIRLSFDLIGSLHWSWGVATLVIGAATALYGVLYAFVQTDLKRLLAYSTIENMGLLFMGLGLALIFFASDQAAIGTLAFIASLYHALNHACFKGLLFLGAGAVHHGVHDNDLNRMGGLARRMPWTALLFLFGALSIASLPPFNGFVSEWLLLQSMLQATVLDSGVLRAAIPVAAAVLVLTAALAAATFVKAHGLAFLSRPRSSAAQHAHETPLGMRLGMLLPALLCLGLGVLPTTVVAALQQVSGQLLDQTLPSATAHGWLWLTPVRPERASYSAPLVFAGISTAVLAWAGVYLLLRRGRQKKPVPRVPPWDCGFGPLSPRMQYSAESFSMPMQRIFRPLYDIDEESASTRESGPEGSAPTLYRRYAPHIADIVHRYCYQPVALLLLNAARRVGALQTGHLHHYLIYSFITLLALLWLTL